MKKTILGFALSFISLFSIQGTAKDWSLYDIHEGWNASDLVRLYFHNSEMQTEWAWQALSHYRFRGNEEVLDFGSGDGKLSAMISVLVPKGGVTGVDISKEMVNFASKKFPSLSYSNLQFLCLENVDFAGCLFSKKFNLVTSFCVLHLVPNATKVLFNIREKMRSDGKLVVTYPVGGNMEFYRAASDEMEARGWPFPQPTQDTAEMRHPEKVSRVFANAGFKIEYFANISTRTPYRTKEELIDWFEGTLTANWNIPEEGRRQFFQDVADRYLKYRPQDIGEDGWVYFTLSRFDIVAVPHR